IQLPENAARRMLFLGSRREFSFGMGLQALGHGIFLLYFKTPFGWWRTATATAVAQRLLRIVAIELIGMGIQRKFRVFRWIFGAVPRLSGINWIFGAVPRLSGIKRIRKFLKPFIERAAERRFSAALEILAGYNGATLRSRSAFVPGRVLLVNSALAWGGAERQLVNTALGLVGRGMRDVTILCDNSAEVPDHDFFLWQLRESSVTILDLRRDFTVGQISSRMQALAPLLRRIGRLVPSFVDDIGFYMQELLERRPEVVHAWQDQTSVKVGLAAMLVGVPKIVLSTRNLAPYNFQYHLPYMRGAYLAILQRENVSFLNNSRAGAADYAAWLRIPSDRCRVVYNGFDFARLERPDHAAIGAYRRRLGLPDGVRIVGSIFRFYEEKDPLLWVRTAAGIARARPDVIFLVIGTGHMQSAMLEFAAELGIADRLFLPGTEKNIAPAYAAMDVFLLTSRFEGLPNVLIEAQALGVPVVTTDAGGCREAVLAGQTGVIVESRDSAKLAERVLFVLDNPDWAAKARQRGPAFVRERFGLKRMIEETLDVYGMEASDRRAPAPSGPGQGSGA
ncbi:MAG: glycosyltransferase, partial [Gammaproteobacteria bacterium]|nr:glycosyltransferase [Gammaproteobacteria bacterium]